VFISEFSLVYRYILDVIDKYVVSVEEELNFTKSYFTLQKIRFSDNIELKINLDNTILESVLPPLSFQLLVENAIKHNAISKEQKLLISIGVEENFIVVKNNLIPKISKSDSKGIGLKNLKKRYEFTAEESPIILLTGEEFIVKLPIMESE
jgi:LytS/YehU family sensor histidine kinase